MDLGITEGGWRLRLAHFLELCNDSDAYGDTVWAVIGRGTDAELSAVLKEYKAGPLQSISPNQVLTPTGATYFGPGIVGRTSADFGSTLVMTSTTGTPAVSTPATLTAADAVMKEGTPVEMLFGPSNRKVPVTWRLLAYLSTNVRHFACTAVMLAVGAAAAVGPLLA